MTDWSAAGRKAWETRRANARKRQRSAAAKKAWATRRGQNPTNEPRPVHIRILSRDVTGFTAIIEPIDL